MKVTKKDLILFIIMFVFTCMVFKNLIVGHYSTDGYNIIDIGYKNYATKFSFNDGRIIMGFIMLLADTMNINYLTFVTVTLVLTISFSVIAIIIIKNIILRYVTLNTKFDKIIVIIISYVIIFNFMYLENLYFIESIVMSISIILQIIAADIIVCKKNNSFLKSFILIFFSMICYQGTISLFPTITFVFSMLKNKDNNKVVINDLLETIIIIIINGIVHIILLKTVSTLLNNELNRINYNFSSIILNILNISYVIPYILIYTSNLIPAGLFLILIVIIYCLFIFGNKKLNNNKNIEDYIKIALILIVAVFTSFIPNIISLTALFAGRIKFAIGAVIGIIYIYIYANTDIMKTKSIYKNLFVIILLSYFIFNIINYIYIIKSHKEVNKIEKEESLQILEYVQNYERINNIKINKVSKIEMKDEIQKAYYNNIKIKCNCTLSALRCKWSTIGTFKYYAKLNLTEVEYNNEIYMNYKKILEKTGYLCIEDTLYICYYMY